MLSTMKRWMPRPVKDAIARVMAETVDRKAVALAARVDQLEAILHDTRTRLAVAEAALQSVAARQGQVESVLRREHASVPIPPRELQVRVAGGSTPAFIDHGYSLYAQLDGHVQAATGKAIADFDRVLDFGCGCGRITRAAYRAARPGVRLSGLDIDAEAIGWAQANCPAVADFRVGPDLPPAPYPDAAFDFVFGVSVFTHLPEDMQFAWLAELRRITTPGAYLALTTHGEAILDMHREWFDDTERLKRGFYFKPVGGTPGLPDYYQVTYHSAEYVRREWAKFFEVVAIMPRGLDDWQDVVVLRRG